MVDSSHTRVAAYIDFDNIVISRYDQLHGRGAFARDRARSHSSADPDADELVSERVAEAKVDVGAVLDYASSFGTVVVRRAYADWSVPVNAGYQRQLVNRAVDLTQLFPSTAGMKNGADIRLAVDVIEDLFRLTDVTHVIIVAGDSDYIALAQRCQRLGRFVVGIGVAGATSRSLVAACDEFSDYDDLPGIARAALARTQPPATLTTQAPPRSPEVTSDAVQPTAKKSAAKKATAKKAASKKSADVRPHQTPVEPSDSVELSPQEAATDLLVRALRLGHEKTDDDWLFSSGVRSQMSRLDPAFKESALGFKSFTQLVESRPDIAELDQKSPQTARRIRLIRE